MEKNIKKVNVESLNLTEEKRRELKELFPEAFPDNILNIETLIDILVPDNEEEQNIFNEHYGLFWPGKKAARKNARTPTQGCLAPLKGKGVDEDKTKNIFIEGENLEVLKLLQKSYAGKIKLIYIDPPYNTGNDFIYKDKFSEGINEYYKKSKQVDEEGNLLTSNPKTSGRYHANWLSMMYPRLELAKNLLRDDGVIFVSIDDNEVHNLRHLMDEIFGQENFLANIVWQKKYAASNDAKGIAVMHDHIIAYSKSLNFKRNLFPRTEENNKPYKHDDNDGRGIYRTDNLLVKTYNDKCVYPIINPNTNEKFFPQQGSCWRFNSEKMNILLNENRIYFGKEGNGAPQLKRYLNEVQQGIVPTTWWSFEDAGHNDEANKQLKDIFDSKSPFDTPKPTKLIKRIMQLSMSESENDYVLDFFSGSGTTAHAVFEQIIEDGKNRNWICVQLGVKPEQDNSSFNKISEIAIERIQRSIKKIKKENTDKIFSDADLGFKYFTLKETNFKTFSSKPLSNITDLEKLFEDSQDVLKDGWNKEDILWEILLQEGFPLHSNIIEEKKILKNLFYRVSTDWCTHELLICLDEKIDTKTEQDLLNLQKHEIEKDFILILRDCALLRNDKIKINLAETFKIRSL